MLTSQAQVKVNMSLSLKDYLESKAQKFDMPLAGYIKHLILKDVSDMDFPTFKISDASEAKAKKAISEKGRAVKVTSVSKYFNEL